MTKQVNKPIELDDNSLDTANGGTDALHLLAQVSHVKAQNANNRAPSPAASKGIIAVLIG